MASITCGKCGETHHELATVKACHAGLVFACGWLVEARFGNPDDGYEIGEAACGAAAVETETGWRCEAGHEHITAEARARQGWDYAADDDEATALAKAGVEPRHMDGHLWVR